VTPEAALRFVEENGVVLMSARGPVPSLAEFVAGEPIRGSWWGHPRGEEIFHAAGEVSESDAVLMCRLVGGKVTFVHRRLWPALVRLAPRLPRAGLEKVWQEHTESGKHVARRLAFPKWVPPDVDREARELSEDAAEKTLAPWLALLTPPPKKKRARRAPRAPRPRS
jgi:hypothetical protein